MGKLNKLLLGLVAVIGVCFALVGCQKPEELKDGYQFGDGTRIGIGLVQKISEYRHEYCVNGSQTARVTLVYLVRSVYPDYPVDGLCSDDDALAKKLSEYLEKDGDKSVGSEPET